MVLMPTEIVPLRADR